MEEFLKSQPKEVWIALIALIVLATILIQPWLIIVWGWIGFTTAMFLIIYGMIRP